MVLLTIGNFQLINALLAVLFGIIIIKWKKSLNYLVGIYFILVGLLGVLTFI
ncbi:MAG: DUF3096 domain-containing protein [Candidatus Woesearchaeota archaeon]